MANLYLHCAICGKKQAHGLISASGWGAAFLPAGSTVDHPAVKGSAIRACPTCVTKDGDWASRALTALGLGRRG